MDGKKMHLHDLFIDRMLLKAELTEALCSLFGVDSSEILIIKSIEEILEADDSVRIVCQSFTQKAEFPFSLTMILRDQSLMPADNIAAVGQLCEILKCRAYMSDDDIEPLNPYSWLLVTGRSDAEQVFIDIEKYDARERYEMQ